MPLEVPNLDDRTYDQLVSEGERFIAKYFPAWTDRNPSDPGITLLELFAFLMEAAIYQINRVPERTLENFVKLVGIEREQDETMDQTISRTIKRLGTSDRTVTKDDFNSLAKQAMPNSIARLEVLIEEVVTPNVFPNDQVVKVIIIPSGNYDASILDDTKKKIFRFLFSRRPITTRLQVIGPTYTDVNISLTVVRAPESQDKIMLQQHVKHEISKFLNPITGGADGKGWEFGKSVFRSELYGKIQNIAGVDHVKRLSLNGDETVDEIPLLSSHSLVSLTEPEVTIVDE